MSGAPRLRSMNVSDSDNRPVLGPAGNKVRSMPAARKPSPKPFRRVERTELGSEDERKKKTSPVDSPHISTSLSAPIRLRRQELLLHSNLSLNASCSSDASTDSFCSRASTGRIGWPSITSRRRQSVTRSEKITAKLEKMAQHSTMVPLPELSDGKRRCAWVTPNTDPCYAAFHDEEWGVPVHDDRKLFELLVLSGALAELTWPTILCKRHIFREVFMDFDPALVSKLNEKKLLAPGSTVSSLLSEPKLRAIVENAHQILKVLAHYLMGALIWDELWEKQPLIIIEEFGSFDKYCWSFVNHKPIMSRFRYPRQVPVKTPKADWISQDLVRRGFRSVGPTVIYSFMQVAGMTNDHLVSCYRFEECAAAVATTLHANGEKATYNVDEKNSANEGEGINLHLSRDVDGLNGLNIIS